MTLTSIRKLKLAWKVHIRWKRTKWQRFWAKAWFLIAFPWGCLFLLVKKDLFGMTDRKKTDPYLY